MSAKRTSTVALFGILSVILCGQANSVHTRWIYDAKIGWLNGGALNIDLELSTDITPIQYDLSGQVVVSKLLRRFFHWQGSFAAAGKMVEGLARSDAYLLIENERKGRTYLLSSEGRTVIYEPGGEIEEHSAPVGTDLMSAVFVSDRCFDANQVHDGEDAYQLELTDQKLMKLRNNRDHYSGPATLCNFLITDTDNKKRRVSIWYAELAGHFMPVQIRFRIPFRPDAVLRLRIREQGS